ncbi:putative dehydrogenase [Saccharopolyspora phatthalungensis]|uniref:Putative dehydrogenase n=1 Tax=Saccharopolyspora phatthalungensis TaxID=664693 RepID=A0A840QEV6_9PSEU|nr:putative dehydrogenase [Saccharopolyspora phatthalungensis]
MTVPHQTHFSGCRALLQHGVHILKEKPFAVTEQDARDLVKMADAADRSVYTLVQRNFNPAFDFASRNLHRTGEPYWFAYDYHINLAKMTSGWRADSDKALGGVMLDMGYHLVDILAGLFASPVSVRAAFLHCYEEMRRQGLEDLVSVYFSYPYQGFAGTLCVSRHNHEKVERLTVLGTDGSLEISPTEASLYSPGGTRVAGVTVTISKEAMVDRMIARYLRHLDDREYRAKHFARQLSTVQVIQRAYESNEGGPDAHPRPSVLANAC